MQALPTVAARVKAPSAVFPFFPCERPSAPAIPRATVSCGLLWTAAAGEQIEAGPVVCPWRAPAETPASILRRARVLEADAALVLETASTDAADLDAQAVDLYQIVMGTLLNLLDRARTEGRWLDIFSAEPEQDVTPFVRLMPPRARFAEVIDLAAARAHRAVAQGGAS